jgi:hypothetical protein
MDAPVTKLTIFKARTLPLLDYFREKGVPLRTVAVDTTTQPPDVCQLIADSF